MLLRTKALSPHTPRDLLGESFSPVPETLGSEGLQILAPRKRLFHQGAQQESHSSVVYCPVTSTSSYQEMSKLGKKSPAQTGKESS